MSFTTPGGDSLDAGSVDVVCSADPPEGVASERTPLLQSSSGSAARGSVNAEPERITPPDLRRDSGLLADSGTPLPGERGLPPLDTLDQARNRLDNPYQSRIVANSTRVEPQGSTLWNESRIDDLLAPPERAFKKGATSNLQTMTHIFKGNVGTGILAMPYAFANIGLVAGFVGTVIIAVIAIHCTRLLVEASHFLCRITGKETLDYGYCIDYAFKNVEGGGPKLRKTGRWMRKLVNFFLQLTQFGFCCVYFVFMGENLNHVLTNYVFEKGYGFKDSRACMAMILPFEMAFCCIRSVKKLSYFSTIANIICVTGLIVVYIQLLQDIPAVDSVPSITTNEVQKWPIFFSMAIYTFEGIGVILPLENKMKNPEDLLPWNGVLNTAMVVVCCLFLSMGFFGYLKFGADVQASITLNLPAAWYNEMVRLFFSLAMFFTFALMLYVPVEIIWPIIRKRIPQDKWKKPLERVFRCFLVLCTFALAIAIPHLGLFISLIGALASSSLALLFPVVIDTLVRWKSRLGRFYWILWKNIFIFIVGLAGFTFGTIQSVREIIAVSAANSTEAVPTLAPQPAPPANTTLHFLGVN